jgi:hypothetical protein
MPNFKSTQYTNQTAARRRSAGSNDMGAIVHKWFDFTVPAGTTPPTRCNRCTVPEGRGCSGRYRPDTSGTRLYWGTERPRTSIWSRRPLRPRSHSAWETIAHNFGEVLAADLILTATVTTEGLDSRKLLRATLAICNRKGTATGGSAGAGLPMPQGDCHA